MKNNALIQWMNQVSRKINATFYAPLSRSNPEHLAFLRNLEKEIEVEKSLFIPLQELKLVVFDFETTGFSPEQGDQILSIGAIKLRNNKLEDNETFYSLVHFDGILSSEIRQLTGLVESDLKTAPSLTEVLISFYQFVQNDILVAHHATHEKQFLQYASWRAFKRTYKHRIVDTSLVFRITNPKENLVSLDDYCTYTGLDIQNRHHALGDAILTAKLWQIYSERVSKQGYSTLNDVYEYIGRK